MPCGLWGRGRSQSKLLLPLRDGQAGETRACLSSDWVRPTTLPHSSQELTVDNYISQWPLVSTSYLQLALVPTPFTARDAAAKGLKESELSRSSPEMESEIAKLKICLESICKVLRNANRILCSISQPSVCSEVLVSSQGTAYILGVAEVYRVSQRVEGGMKARNVSSETLQQCLRDIHLVWNNLQAFLSLCPSVLQLLPPEPNLSCEVGEGELDSSPCPRLSCGVCLTRVPEHKKPLTDEKDSLLLHQGYPYHVSCANFWLNCVDTTLPTSSSQRRCEPCVKPLESTEFPEVKDLLQSTS